MPTTLRRVGLATAATSLVMGTCVVTAGSASAEARFDFTRIEGPNRYATAAKAAGEYGKADTVILASGERNRYADALTANYLSGLENAPILLTRKGDTPDETSQAIKDSGAKNVIIVGGTGVISQGQEDTLRKAYDVRRIAGADRYGTAAKVISEGDKAKSSTALLATGTNFPDALGGGPVSYAEGMPLAITRPDDAPDDVVRALDEAGIDKVVVLGGEAAVGDAVVKELAKKGITVEKRVDGKDRAETSAKLADYAIANYGFKQTAVNVASGYNNGQGADALSGAPLTGQDERALLITRSNTTAGDGVLDFLGKHGNTLTQGVIFGGEAAVAKSAEYAMEKAVLGSGAQNTRTGEFYNNVESALAEANKGDTITVFGTDNPGFTVNKEGVTIQGEDGAQLKSAVVIRGVDDVTISGLSIAPSDVGGQVAGVYLDNAEGTTISNNTVTGSDGETGAGVINATGGEDEVAKISGNTFRELRQGVYANPTAEYTIDSNVFRANMAGSANDAPSVITNNRFINNDEGIGLADNKVGDTPAATSTVKGNYFNNNYPHVTDYTTDKSYNLEQMIKDNSFQEPAKVSEDDTKIVDAS